MLDRESVIREYHKLGTLQAVASLHGVTRERIRQVIGDDESYAKAMELRSVEHKSRVVLSYVNEGLTTKEIAGKMGVSASSVWKYCQVAGVKPVRDMVEVGCVLCSEVPYSLGLCRRCYGNWTRRGKNEKEREEAYRRIDASRRTTTELE